MGNKIDQKAARVSDTRAGETFIDGADGLPRSLLVFLGLGGEEVRLSAEMLSEVDDRIDVCVALKARIWRAACEALPGFGSWEESTSEDEEILAEWLELVRASAPPDAWVKVVGVETISELCSEQLFAIIRPPIDAYAVAARVGSKLLVRVLLARAECDLDQRSFGSERQSTPLLLAAEKGCVDVVKLLVENRADVEEVDAERYTPLLLASERGQLDVVKTLVELGADVNHPKAGAPLLFASVFGNLEMVKLLVEKGADVNQSGTETGETPLLIASACGRLDVAKLLVELGADVNQVSTETGETPLQRASLRRHLDMVKLLVENGAE